MAVVVVEPFPKIAFVGRFAPAGPISQLEMVLLSLPSAVRASVENKIVAPSVVTAIVAEPFTLQLVIVLLVAPPIKRIVEVAVTAEVLVLVIVRSFKPVWFTLPSMVTLSAPFKLISGAVARLPPIVKPVTVGYIFIEV